jgi:hypothetical protein
MQFLAEPKPGSDEPAHTVVCYRHIVVRDDSIEVVALFEERSLDITRAWVPESILQVFASYFMADDEFFSISFEPNSRLVELNTKHFDDHHFNQS